MLTKIEYEELKILEEVNRRKTKESLLEFIKFTKPNYQTEWFHQNICSKIEAFERKEIKKLMIFVPPQHGKSEISTRRYPAWSLGHNPDQKIGVISYNQTIGSKFGKDIQRIMQEEEYTYLFPDVILAKATAGGWLKNQSEFEIPDHKGNLISIGIGGALTSRQIDKLIIDDIYKDAKDAWSPVIRESVWNWYTSVAETRLHNDSQTLIVFTRWHEDDLGGRLLQDEANEWEVIKYPAIKTEEKLAGDNRIVGQALWENRHSKEKLLKIKKKSPLVFENLYQQDPRPKMGLLYTKFMEYEELPNDDRKQIKAYCDVADTGDDYLCSIVYLESQNRAFILDVIYTQDPVEITEDLVANQYIKFQVNQAIIESNNGGRAFARNVERIMSEKDHIKTQVITFHQSQNKTSRIHTEQSTVQNSVYYPKYWNVKFPSFYDALTKYQRIGKNEHDDAPDCITGVAEELQKSDAPFIF